MSNNLDQLGFFIDMLSKENNPLHIKKMWSLIRVLAERELGEMPEKESVKLVSDIHELNLEQVIRLQAEMFYDGFPLPEKTVKLLKNDFIQMEHSRRRNDYEAFSLGVYQQLENIINYLFETKNVFEILSKRWDQPALLKKSGIEKGSLFGQSLINLLITPPYVEFRNRPIDDVEAEKREKSNEAKSAFKRKQKHEFTFIEKSKMIVFSFYFGYELFSYDTWNSVNDMIRKIHQSRNKIHRDSSESGEVKPRNTNQYVNYLMFHGFLADFMQKIHKNLHNRNSS